MYKVVFAPQALDEFASAFDWYESKTIGLGGKFELQVKSALQQIAEAPFQVASRTKGYREIKIKTFPFVIIFRCWEDQQVLLVTSIYHTSRNPKRKYRRPHR